MTNSSQVAEHCIVYSLSDSAQAPKANLDHLTEKVKEAKFPSADDHDETVYLTQSAKKAIEYWKCHILRAINQDQAHTDVLDLLDDETVLIVNDWAMKFLPRKYCESQTDWFGKRGISWHISVIYRRFNRVLQWQGLIHIIQSCSQGSPSVVRTMEDVLKTIKHDPDIKKAYFRQDNAGY